MPKLPKARKVLTPGSTASPSTPKPTKRVGRPAAARPKGRSITHRTSYSSEDMEEAIRLVTIGGMTCAKAAKFINGRKKNAVPRMTLYDRTRDGAAPRAPALGRPQELSPAVELALVKSLQMCAEFQYPMKKKDLKDLVQVKK